MRQTKNHNKLRIKIQQSLYIMHAKQTDTMLHRTTVRIQWMLYSLFVVLISFHLGSFSVSSASLWFWKSFKFLVAALETRNSKDRYILSIEIILDWNERRRKEKQNKKKTGKKQHKYTNGKWLQLTHSQRAKNLYLLAAYTFYWFLSPRILYIPLK